MRKLFLVVARLFIPVSADAQTGELVLEKGVAAPREIDAIYKSLSAAYRALDVEMVANRYSGTAAYLSPEKR